MSEEAKRDTCVEILFCTGVSTIDLGGGVSVTSGLTEGLPSSEEGTISTNSSHVLYFGPLNPLPNGRGQMFCPENNDMNEEEQRFTYIYRGNFIDGERHGLGTITRRRNDSVHEERVASGQFARGALTVGTVYYPSPWGNSDAAAAPRIFLRGRFESRKFYGMMYDGNGKVIDCHEFHLNVRPSGRRDFRTEIYADDREVQKRSLDYLNIAGFHHADMKMRDYSTAILSRNAENMY